MTKNVRFKTKKKMATQAIMELVTITVKAVSIRYRPLWHLWLPWRCWVPLEPLLAIQC